MGDASYSTTTQLSYNEHNFSLKRRKINFEEVISSKRVPTATVESGDIWAKSVSTSMY